LWNLIKWFQTKPVKDKPKKYEFIFHTTERFLFAMLLGRTIKPESITHVGYNPGSFLFPQELGINPNVEQFLIGWITQHNEDIKKVMSMGEFSSDVLKVFTPLHCNAYVIKVSLTEDEYIEIIKKIGKIGTWEARSVYDEEIYKIKNLRPDVFNKNFTEEDLVNQSVEMQEEMALLEIDMNLKRTK